MYQRIALLLCCFATAMAFAGDIGENWLEVRSQHFTVLTNANEKTGRRIADQFERMRSVFHVMLPQLPIDNGSPVIVLATKEDRDFRALEPQSYLNSGQLKLGGLFLKAPDKNYVLMRVDARGEHPYAVIYHEYTHLLLSKSTTWLPLWLNEGLAELYENTDIHDKDVALGQPSYGNLELLRHNRLLPLSALFAIDESSPYYHEKDKGSIFYAESWALTHYLFVKDNHENTHHLSGYIHLLTEKKDAVGAAKESFGDLAALQSKLEDYIHQGKFSYFTPPIATGIDESTFTVNPLRATQVNAVLADLLAYNERIADARAMLDRILEEDPKNVLAHETMGLLEFRADHLDEARKWYEQAVKLDSQSYIAHYYFAAISMSDLTHGSDDAAVEGSLRAAIKLNPQFAPAFERLAAFQGMRHQNLEEAHMMALTAVTLDPGNVAYRMTTASVLIEMHRTKDAVDVLLEAMRLAKSPQETAMVQSLLSNVESYRSARDEQSQGDRVESDVEADATSSAEVPLDSPSETLPNGPHRFLVGMLQNVHCNTPRIDLTLDSKGKSTLLHSGNYYKIEFSALGFTPSAELNPCKDLEGKSAKVEYVESSAKLAPAYVVAIELHK